MHVSLPPSLAPILFYLTQLGELGVEIDVFSVAEDRDILIYHFVVLNNQN